MKVVYMINDVSFKKIILEKEKDFYQESCMDFSLFQT